MIDRIARSSQPDDLDRKIANLVAEELGEADRRELLLRLEETPDGWKRCALGFLEDQALRSTLGLASTARELASLTLAVPATNEKRKIHSGHLRYVAAMLTGLALIGSYWLGRSSVGPLDRPGAVAAPPIASAAEPPPAPGRPVGFLSWSDPTMGELPARIIPVIADTPTNERWARKRPDAISDYVRAQWERQGYRINEDHRLMAVDIGMGQRGAVPVDEVELQYVGQRPL